MSRARLCVGEAAPSAARVDVGGPCWPRGARGTIQRGEGPAGPQGARGAVRRGEGPAGPRGHRVPSSSLSPKVSAPPRANRHRSRAEEAARGCPGPRAFLRAPRLPATAPQPPRPPWLWMLLRSHCPRPGAARATASPAKAGRLLPRGARPFSTQTSPPRGSPA